MAHVYKVVISAGQVNGQKVKQNEQYSHEKNTSIYRLLTFIDIRDTLLRSPECSGRASVCTVTAMTHRQHENTACFLAKNVCCRAESNSSFSVISAEEMKEGRSRKDAQ